MAFRRKRAEKEKEQGIRRPRVQPSTSKPPVVPCKYYMKGRCTLVSFCIFLTNESVRCISASTAKWQSPEEPNISLSFGCTYISIDAFDISSQIWLLAIQMADRLNCFWFGLCRVRCAPFHMTAFLLPNQM
jgi:hypothetical protein